MPEVPQDTYAIVTAIRRIVRAVTLHGRRTGRESGLTVAQFLALKAIGDRPGGTVATEILDEVQVSAGTLSGIVQRLVDLGHVHRVRDPNDRRRVLLTITPTGLELLASTSGTLQDRFLVRLDGLDEAERTEILDVLERVVALMEAQSLDASPILTHGTAVDDDAS